MLKFARSGVATDDSVGGGRISSEVILKQICFHSWKQLCLMCSGLDVMTIAQQEGSILDRQVIMSGSSPGAAAASGQVQPSSSTGLHPLSSSESVAAISLLALAPHTPPSVPSPQPSPVQHGDSGDLAEAARAAAAALQAATQPPLPGTPMDTAGQPLPQPCFSLLCAHS